MSDQADRADLGTRADLDRVLRAFYTRAFADPLLGPVFLDVAGMDLQAHLPVIGAFWEKVLFNTGCYDRQPMRVHRALHQREPLTPAHFARWLSIWDQTLDQHYSGPVADRAKQHAARIAVAMQRHLTQPVPRSRTA